MSSLNRRSLFWEKVEKTDSCWLWRGGVSSNGYGAFWNGSSTQGAHVMAWVYDGRDLGGPDEKLELDHLCETPLCVRPDHLELVTHAENIRRHWAKNPRTHCHKGHSLEDAYIRTNGNKRCRPCAANQTRAWKDRKREAVNV